MKVKGPRSEATKAILAFIQANAPVPQQELADHFRPQAAAVGMAVNSWLNSRLDNMRVARYIEHGPKGWTALPFAGAPVSASGAKRRTSREHQVPETSVAEPRRVSMFGPTYQPAPQVHRAGSLDYARHPSVINGQPRSFRSAP